MIQEKSDRLLILGYTQEYHMGCHLLKAAQKLGLHAEIVDLSLAFESSWITRQIYYRILNRRPPNLQTFCQRLIKACQEYQPRWLLVTGIFPLPVQTIQSIKSLQIKLLNYLTDDPWNPSHFSKLFLDNLVKYDLVFTPRKSNLNDLISLGCTVRYVQFGYEPSIHYPEFPPAEITERYSADVMFYGGADSDRLPMMNAIHNAGLKLRLYGGYWNRYRRTKSLFMGHALGAELRWAVSSSKVCLCPVRRANRDGHVMRSFEIPAMGGCPLVEDTDEHREIFGNEGECVLYFKNNLDLVSKACLLLHDDDLRSNLSHKSHQHITTHGNTYFDRLVEILHYTENDSTWINS